MSACKKSRIGAQIACEIAADIILDHINYYFDSDIEKVKSIILMNIRNAIKHQAKADNATPEDYASTLSFVCVNKRHDHIMTFSLGDSRIYLITDNNIVYLNQTLTHAYNRVCATVSYGAEREAVLDRSDYTPGEKYLLCTDGMWRTAVNNGLFSVPENVESGKDLADELEEYLINDDCSFLLAA